MSSDRAKMIFLMLLAVGAMLGWGVLIWLLLAVLCGVVVLGPIVIWHHREAFVRSSMHRSEGSGRPGVALPGRARGRWQHGVLMIAYWATVVLLGVILCFVR